MTEYELNIAYKEGSLAYKDGLSVLDCPYYDVSETLSRSWEEGWWDMWYSE